MAWAIVVWYEVLPSGMGHSILVWVLPIGYALLTSGIEAVSSFTLWDKLVVKVIVEDLI